MSITTTIGTAVGGLALAVGAFYGIEAVIPETIVVVCGEVTVIQKTVEVTVTALTNCRAGDIPVTINPPEGVQP